MVVLDQLVCCISSSTETTPAQCTGQCNHSDTCHFTPVFISDRALGGAVLLLCKIKTSKMSRLSFLPLLLYLMISTNIAPSWGYGSGSPRSQCGSMTPGHGQQPQDNSDAPFTVKLSASQIAKGSQVIVELKSNSGETFKGFIIEARSVERDSIIGTFETVSSGDSRYLSCDSTPQTAVTHTNNSPKKSVTVRWSPPADFTGNVKVLGSFVKEYNTYWVKLESETLEVTNTDAGEGFVFPSENSSPEPESEGEPEPESEGEPGM